VDGFSGSAGRILRRGGGGSFSGSQGEDEIRKLISDLIRCSPANMGQTRGTYPGSTYEDKLPRVHGSDPLCIDLCLISLENVVKKTFLRISVLIPVLPEEQGEHL